MDGRSSVRSEEDSDPAGVHAAGNDNPDGELLTLEECFVLFNLIKPFVGTLGAKNDDTAFDELIAISLMRGPDEIDNLYALLTRQKEGPSTMQEFKQKLLEATRDQNFSEIIAYGIQLGVVEHEPSNR